MTLDNRYHKITTGYRASDNGVNRLVFESDMTWATPNRGITFADSGTTRNDWGVAIADGATVSIACPLYGAAADKGAAKTRFGINGELEGFRTGTLRLCGAQGDWAGTFVATNGTLVLAGAKPLGEGTLDISGAAHVELDASALAGGACYVKAATDTTRIGVTLPDGFDPETDLALISTPAEGGVTKDQLVFSGGLPEGLALRSSVRDGVRTFAVGRKHGLVLIFR